MGFVLTRCAFCSQLIIHVCLLRYFSIPFPLGARVFRATAAYAFEVLYRPSTAGWGWDSFCKSKTIGVLDPFSSPANIATYLSHGYVSSPTIMPLKTWKPRPEFEALFTVSSKKREEPLDLDDQIRRSLWGTME